MMSIYIALIILLPIFSLKFSKFSKYGSYESQSQKYFPSGPKSTAIYNGHSDDVPRNNIGRVSQGVNRILHRTAIITLNSLLVSAASTSVHAQSIASQISLAPSSADQSTRKITSVAYLDVKIANYTEESIGKNVGASGSGRVVIGLFGEDAPLSVQRFLETVQSDGEALPTYINSQFSKVTDDNLLQLDDVPRLDVVNIAGTEQYQYGGEILTNYKPILDTNSIRHDRRGLLTRRQLSTGPEFGITLGPAASLDGFHVVFGEVLEGQEVIDSIAQIRRYTYQTSTGYAGKEKGLEGALADKWFESQKSFYVGVGRALGDKRAVDRRGKLLRRVRIIGCGKLDESSARKYM